MNALDGIDMAKPEKVGLDKADSQGEVGDISTVLSQQAWGRPAGGGPSPIEELGRPGGVSSNNNLPELFLCEPLQNSEPLSGDSGKPGEGLPLPGGITDHMEERGAGSAAGGSGFLMECNPVNQLPGKSAKPGKYNDAIRTEQIPRKQ